MYRHPAGGNMAVLPITLEVTHLCDRSLNKSIMKIPPATTVMKEEGEGREISASKSINSTEITYIIIQNKG